MSPSPPGVHPTVGDRVATVGGAMVRFPKTCPATSVVAMAREWFRDDHVHVVLVVRAGVLLTVVERTDLVGVAPTTALRSLGTTVGRVVGPDVALATALAAMRDARRRRLAVVDRRGVLLGLLCLKRSGTGFCTDAGIVARAGARLSQAG